MSGYGHNPPPPSSYYNHIPDYHQVPQNNHHQQTQGQYSGAQYYPSPSDGQGYAQPGYTNNFDQAPPVPYYPPYEPSGTGYYSSPQPAAPIQPYHTDIQQPHFPYQQDPQVYLSPAAPNQSTPQQPLLPIPPSPVSTVPATHLPIQPSPGPSESVSGIAPIKLVIKRPASSQPTTLDPGKLDMSRRGSNFDEPYGSGRPVRGARLVAEKSFSRILQSSDEEDDEPVSKRTSSRGNKGKARERYRGEDDFEDKMMDTSPVKSPERRTSGRVKRNVIYDPDEDEDDTEEEVVAEDVKPRRASIAIRSTRSSRAAANGHEGEEELEVIPERPSRSTRASRAVSRHSSADAESFAPTHSETAGDESEDPIGQDFDEYDDEDDFVRSPSPRRSRRTTRSKAASAGTRRSARAAARQHDSEDEYGAPKRTLRQRTSKVNYELPPLDISAELMTDAIASVSGPSRRRGVGFAGGTRFGAGAGSKGLPWSMRGSQLARAMGDSSDSDLDLMTPLKPTGGSGTGGGQAAVGAGPRVTNPSDVPNFGRINPKSNMADADPLGVDVNVTFDNVGGLDGHINQLKEMVALPLLYPELFLQFGITPPRGVLFHGPPGTGKTLLARALAASCSNGNTKIAFFMRKGADVLSKWVGEAERQLRMLFEEARAAQPSIIFFDEIDGLAPVRSSKQDQIHASLVSTLLALMDGMDGRGQVIVIGATNRPDSVDPALRRPGRFDREFYFPLPNKDARKKIIGINTRKWTPGLSDDMLDQLAALTKGYGGADLRALCTEAALNAIQRRYPQIYSTSDRLLLDPSSISVGAKDFMLSVKRIVPSSARSTTSAAIQLPPHLAPLLSSPLERLKLAIDTVLPRHKPKTALEEAEWEDDVGDDLEKHMMIQSLDKMRTFRPRLLVHGPAGMGQGYLGPAVLHHLEGFHVQSLDLGSLLGDSVSTTEAALVQQFVEAKRHQPSILFIPSLLTFSLAIPESARTTFKALLDGIPSSDPVLLLAILDGDVSELPRDVRRWFGIGKEGRVDLTAPTSDERTAYFASLIEQFTKPPTAFPDAIPRRKRVLEVLPPAPPLPPRPPTEAELQRELDRDNNARNMMVISFTGLLSEFSKKYRKVVATVREDAFQLHQILTEQAAASVVVPPAAPLLNGHSTGDDDIPTFSSSAPAILTAPPTEAVVPIETPAIPPPTWAPHDTDLDTLNRKLFRHKYYVPQDFLDDVELIRQNAINVGDPDRTAKVVEMAAHARLHVAEFDPKWTPEFERLKQRMTERKAEREKQKAAQAEAEKEKAADDETAQNADSLKRPREGEDEGGRAEKRQRENEMEVDEAVPSDVTVAATHHAPTSPPVPAIPPTENAVAGPSTHAASVPPPREEPIVPPPLICPAEAIAALGAELKHKTMNLNVDQLEQLRAGCYDRLWRSRAEWDRTKVIADVRGWIGEFVQEVREQEED